MEKTEQISNIKEKIDTKKREAIKNNLFLLNAK